MVPANVSQETAEGADIAEMLVTFTFGSDVLAAEQHAEAAGKVYKILLLLPCSPGKTSRNNKQRAAVCLFTISESRGELHPCVPPRSTEHARIK